MFRGQFSGFMAKDSGLAVEGLEFAV